jgi:Rrf2 family protein
MQISAKADYAVRALVELAADSDRPLTCESIASSRDIPFRFLKSVFRDLRGAGLVRSQRGCEGGYWIGREPAAISVAEVMTAVDGEFLTLRGERPAVLAYPGAARRLPGLWGEVEAAALSVLAGTTIGELAASGAAAADTDGAPVAAEAPVTDAMPVAGTEPVPDTSPAVPA